VSGFVRLTIEKEPLLSMTRAFSEVQGGSACCEKEKCLSFCCESNVKRTVSHLVMIKVFDYLYVRE